MLQKRHLPNQPLEYLLKLRYETKSGFKYRERWIAAGRLCAEFAVGAALIKQFEESKVGQLAVDTYLSKRRSLPSPVLSSQDHQTTDVRYVDRNVDSAGKSLKRKSCEDLDRLHGSANSLDGVSLKSLKSTDNCVLNNSASPLHAGTGTAPSRHKLLPVAGAAAQPLAQHKQFAKRLLLCDPVPRNDWSKNKSKDFKLPSLEQCKTAEHKSALVSCRHEDSDSEDDIRYTLATDHSDESSNDEKTNINDKQSSYSKKKQRTLTSVDGVKNKKNNTADDKQLIVNGDPEINFRTTVSAAQSSFKAGTCCLTSDNIIFDRLCVVIS